MKKSLIALLVATLPAAAFADVTIYGAIKGGVENVDQGSKKVTNVDDLGSRIGFKGSEDLGNGLKAIWQVETGFGIDGQARTGSKSGTFANRESFIGLQSSFGKIRLGNVSNFLDSDLGTVDPWEYSDNALGLGVFTRDGSRLKNSVRYDAPTLFAGFNAAIQYGTKEQSKNINTVNVFNSQGEPVSQDRETFGLGLSYENSGFFGKYSYVHESPVAIAVVDNKLVGKANDKHRVEVGYDANNLFVGFGYQFNKGGDVAGSDWSDLVEKGAEFDQNAKFNIGDKMETREYALTVAYSFGAITPKFTYAKGEDIEVGSNTLKNSGYDQFVLGADYALSKRTKIGAQYGQISLKGKNDDAKAFGLNVIHKF